MKELDMIKAFAELEGAIDSGIIESHDGVEVRFNKNGFLPYNPITDWALTFKAMVDYKVEIDFVGLTVSCCLDENLEFVLGFVNDSEIPSLIIECILKSKGLWVCQK